jgi:hypothetical protein
MAKGAAFYAASFSARFGARPIEVIDGLNFPVHL